MTTRYTLAELQDLPTLATGQADDLKVDNGDGMRVWLARVGVEDGAEYDHLVTVERFDGHTWQTVAEYPAS